MIKLAKGPKPDVLAQNAATWTAELIAEGDKAKAKSARYGHRDVKAALISETSGKCAYCESKFLHVTYGDVEHIVAKALDPRFAYQWENLTIACDRCNTRKGDKEGLLDPYTDDPSSFVSFGGPWLAAVIGSEIGRFTVVVLGLNRTELLERRVERLNDLRNQLEVILATKDASRRGILLNALVDAVTNPSAEFSACMTKRFGFCKRRGIFRCPPQASHNQLEIQLSRNQLGGAAGHR